MFGPLTFLCKYVFPLHTAASRKVLKILFEVRTYCLSSIPDTHTVGLESPKTPFSRI